MTINYGGAAFCSVIIQLRKDFSETIGLFYVCSPRHRRILVGENSMRRLMLPLLKLAVVGALKDYSFLSVNVAFMARAKPVVFYSNQQCQVFLLN